MNMHINLKMGKVAVATLLIGSMFSLSAAGLRYEITDLGKLDGISSGGRMVNESGKVVGYVMYDNSGDSYAFVTDSENNMIALQPWEGTYSVARAINESGQVVVNSRSPEGEQHAFVMDSENNIIDIGTLGGTYSQAFGINDSGLITGQSATSSGEPYAFVTDDEGNMINLRALGGRYSWASAINESGQVAGSLDIFDGKSHAFVTDSENNMIDLGTLGGKYSRATAINESGQVVGSSHISYRDNTGHPFVTDSENNMIDLGTFGGKWGSAYAINNSGKVIGYSMTADGEYRAFVTDSENNMIDLGTLGGKYSIATAINESGQVVGNSYTIEEEQHAFVTDSEGKMVDLNELVDNLSTNWSYLRIAIDISNTGYITGDGITANGETHAFLLTPLDTTPPAFTVLPEDKTVEATGVLTDVELGDVKATDNSGTVTISNDAPESGFVLGVTTVTWTATDEAGNTATATQIITVQDTTAPVLTAPDDITIRGNRTLNIVDFGTATATDIFEPVTITNDAPVDGFPRKSTTTVTWTATDANGNTATATQLVTLTNKKVESNDLTISEAPSVIGITHKSVVIKWRTNIKSDSVVEYGIEVIDLSKISTKEGKNHSIELKGLSQGTTYQYRVISTTKEGEVVSSEIYHFTTNKK